MIQQAETTEKFPQILVDVRGAAKILAVSPRTIYKFVEQGHLRQIKIGPHGRRYALTDLELCVERLRNEAEPKNVK